MSYEEFITLVWEKVRTYPKDWRKGQSVFNAVEEIFGNVARDVQFIDGVDCFYLDKNIDDFLDCVWKRLNNE